jgi:hypothetical protein
MSQDADCAGDNHNDCAHTYVQSSSNSADCLKCGHSTRLGAHDWRPYPVGRYCPGCGAWLMIGKA